MWVVLCEHGDASVDWVCQGLLERDLAPLEVVTPEQLVYARRWEHRVGEGDVYSDVWLADGRRLRSTHVQGVLNRLAGQLQPPLGVASPEDRDYARHEITALVASWLHGLPCQVLNRPPGHAVSGPWLQVPEWLVAGHDVGFPTITYARGSARDSDDPLRSLLGESPLATAFVVGSEVVAAPANLVEPCLQLARRVGADLLGLTFVLDDVGPAAEWRFVVASPVPDLTEGGARLLDVMATALRAGR